MDKINDLASRAWNIHNITAFMVEALPDDALGALPVRSAICQLREMSSELAMDIMELDNELLGCAYGAKSAASGVYPEKRDK
ncbi:hypothetical protein B0G57_1216 [Trinickia symbiotica]|uniref:Uncharacterized protein n=1 Tax=Trinickia symbiotica TaxID=863227 RepID=A0A2N7WTY1_9BURK|nr:hypothetical protein [Trinickia symbiotica]PMS32802.1 hypothetical protein C0Z20_25915 [Trinickia symbiotica]PPK42092.1 hypothetical protein B0G57_1216 [Trinickia symbiotica]